MKTAIVVTNWAGTEDYREKTVKFLKYYSNDVILKALGISMKDIWIIDNASTQEDLIKLERLCYKENLNPKDYSWKYFNKHLTRPTHLEYAYVWRALYFGRDLFQEEDYEKIIHMNNDSYILSEKLMNFIKDFKSGWWSPFCPKHGFKECDINVYTKDHVPYWELTAKPYMFYNGKLMEGVLPISGEKNWIGDRYAEYPIEIPINADFVTQVRYDTKIEYNK